MHHLILDLDDLLRINRTWPYKDLKVSDLQANAISVKNHLSPSGKSYSISQYWWSITNYIQIGGRGFVTTTYRCEKPPRVFDNGGIWKLYTGMAQMVRVHAVPYTRSWVRVPPMLVFFLDRHLEPKRLGCHAGHEEVSRGYTRGESEECRWGRKQVKDLPWLWNPGQEEVQNRGISGSTESTGVLQNFYLKYDILDR